ncbi:predicted protein, partial [Nematostella vectensis]
VTIPASPFMTKLGYGTGVNVYRFKRSSIEGKSPWAVKKVNPKARPGISERLALEASILKDLNHPNIVGFRALIGNTNGDLCLAMEDCHMSLMDKIEERSYLEEKFVPKEIFAVAWAIGNALEYLHFEKKILHGDMKSGNILIRGPFESVKLCDFGVALRLKGDLSGLLDPKGRYIGSEPWKSKEALNRGGVVCDKTDIFAYGLVIWEMLALDVPHVSLLDGSMDTDMSCEEDSEEYTAALGTRPPLPKENYDQSFNPLIELFDWCTAEDPRDRPSARQVVDFLKPHIMTLSKDC